MADTKYYEVEKLVKKKVENKKLMYLVRWKNFGPEYDTWEPATNLKTCYMAFIDFERRQKCIKSSSVAAKLLKKSRELSNKSSIARLSNSSTTIRNSTENKSHKIKELKAKPKKLGIVAPLTKQSKTLKQMDDRKKNTTISLSKKTPSITEKKTATKREGQLHSSYKKKKKILSPLKRQLEVGSPGKKDDTKEKKQKLQIRKTGSLAKKYSKSKKKVNNYSTDNLANFVVDNAVNEMTPSVDNTERIAQTLYSKEKIPAYKTLQKSKHITDNNNSTFSEDEFDSDDDSILYSLNEPESGHKESEHKKHQKQKKSLSDKQSVKKLSKKASQTFGSSLLPSKNSRKRMSLLDFKKPKSKQKQAPFAHLLRPSSPTPFFTPLKAAAHSPLRGALVPSSSSLAMDSLVGDVPAYQAAPTGPLSPSSMSYKILLDDLPSQLHPRSKGSKKKENGSGVSSTTCGSGRDAGDNENIQVAEPIERRISVRATECVFRYKQIVVKKCHRYTQIWLNTQTTLKNAFNPSVVQEVVAALNTAKYDDSSLVLFGGIGNVFSSGTDLHFLVTGDRRVAARQMADALRELTKAFITFPKPVMAAVGGAAVGLGVALLCLCDVVYSSDKASFHLPYSNLSQTPEGCSSFTLPLALGLASANELLFGGRCITAMEAYQLGLVSHVFWPTALMQEVIPRAENMASCSAKVLEGTKLLIRSHHRTKLELTNETECNLLLERWSSNECQRAIEAYLANENNFSH